MQNKGFPTDWLSELKQKNNIVSVIGKTIRLERKGNKFWACCPFHHEKTPSFTVSEDEGYFYCFGCKEHGDVIAYIQKFESCDFQEAISILAKNAGMEVPQYQGTQENTQKKQLKERVLKLLEETYKHYQANLYTKEAKPAQDYIKQRGFTRRELEDFKLGYSLNWTDLIGHLRKHGYTYNEMLEAGVVQAKEKENGKTTYYDVMAGRLCFPIFNAFNECVGFSARALEKTDYAKYKNTAETVVFQKGRVVFGINLVKALKQSGNLDKVIIVEGQIDVIAMHRAGFKSTVACMGTALTKENAKELKKLSNKVVLCFDGDTAGIKATIKSIEILKEEGFDIRIAQMPDGHDPDEILRLQGKQALEEIINKALPPTDYLIENELKKYNLSHADEKGKFTQSALDIIAKLDSSSMEEPYLEKIRDITNVPIDILRRDIAKIKKGITLAKLPEKEGQNVLVSRENGNNRAVKYVLGSLIFKKPFVRREIDYKKLLPRFADVIDKALAGIPISSYYDYFDVENMPTLKDCLAIDFDLYKNNAQVYFDECIRLIASQELSKRQEELTKQFTECRVQEERLEIMKKLNAVNKALREKSLEEFYVR